MKELEEQGLKYGVTPKEDGSRKLQKYIHRQIEKEKRSEEIK